MAVAFQLVIATLFGWLFYLDDEVRNSRPIVVEHDDIRALGRVAPKGNGVFNRESGCRVFELVFEAIKPELPDCFLWFQGYIFPAHTAFR